MTRNEERNALGVSIESRKIHTALAEADNCRDDLDQALQPGAGQVQRYQSALYRLWNQMRKYLKNYDGDVLEKTIYEEDGEKWSVGDVEQLKNRVNRRTVPETDWRGKTIGEQVVTQPLILPLKALRALHRALEEAVVNLGYALTGPRDSIFTTTLEDAYDEGFIEAEEERLEQEGF